MHIDLRLGSSNTRLCGRSLHMHNADACCHRRSTLGQRNYFYLLAVSFVIGLHFEFAHNRFRGSY